MATIIISSLVDMAAKLMQAFGFGIVLCLMLALFFIAAIYSSTK